MTATLPVRNLVAALERVGESSAEDLALELGYSRERVYTFIEDARREGTAIVAVANPGEATTFGLRNRDEGPDAALRS